MTNKKVGCPVCGSACILHTPEHEGATGYYIPIVSQPSSEYVKVVEDVIKDALHDLKKLNNEGWTPTLTSARERARKIHADLTEALATLKSHPTPAKEPSEELVEAAKKMANWWLDGMLDFDYADALEILIDHKKLQNAVAAYHAQVTKEGKP